MMPKGLQGIIDSLALERLDSPSETLTRFTGLCDDDNGERIYGGQVMAQAMSAGQQTVAKPYVLHSMHSTFLRQGAIGVPLTYCVEAMRNGRSFLSRQVVVEQNNKIIFTATLSFQKPEHGVSHAAAMPDAPNHESLIKESHRINDFLASKGINHQYDWPIDIRFVNPPAIIDPQPQSPRLLAWIKTTAALPDNDNLQRQMFAYASDNPILMPAFFPHCINPFTPNVMAATLSHSIWIHQSLKIGDWLLFEVDSDFTGGGRGMGRAKVFNTEGQLVASAVQEGLVRQR